MTEDKDRERAMKEVDRNYQAFIDKYIDVYYRSERLINKHVLMHNKQVYALDVDHQFLFEIGLELFGLGNFSIQKIQKEPITIYNTESAA